MEEDAKFEELTKLSTWFYGKVEEDKKYNSSVKNYAFEQQYYDEKKDLPIIQKLFEDSPVNEIPLTLYINVTDTNGKVKDVLEKPFILASTHMENQSLKGVGVNEYIKLTVFTGSKVIMISNHYFLVQNANHEFTLDSISPSTTTKPKVYQYNVKRKQTSQTLPVVNQNPTIREEESKSKETTPEEEVVILERNNDEHVYTLKKKTRVLPVVTERKGAPEGENVRNAAPKLTGLQKPFRELCKKAGAQAATKDVYPQLYDEMEDFVQEVLFTANSLYSNPDEPSEDPNNQYVKNPITKRDILLALRQIKQK
jgi:hypothetical protein